MKKNYKSVLFLCLLSLSISLALITSRAQAEDSVSEAEKQAQEQAREQAKKEAESVKKELEDQRESAKQILEEQRERSKTLLELYTKYNGLSEDERETIKTQLETQVEQAKQEREKIFANYQDQLKQLKELRSDELEQIREQRQQQLEELKQRRTELEQQNEEPTEAERTKRVANAVKHAAKIGSRLDAAVTRLAGLVEKIQNKIDTIDDSELATELNTKLAALVDQQESVTAAVATAKINLENISNVTGDSTAVQTAEQSVKSAIQTLNDLKKSLKELAIKLP